MHLSGPRLCWLCYTAVWWIGSVFEHHRHKASLNSDFIPHLWRRSCLVPSGLWCLTDSYCDVMWMQSCRDRTMAGSPCEHMISGFSYPIYAFSSLLSIPLQAYKHTSASSIILLSGVPFLHIHMYIYSIWIPQYSMNALNVIIWQPRNSTDVKLSGRMGCNATICGVETVGSTVLKTPTRHRLLKNPFLQ